ncbi:unnamed protein product [Staurois parvus]|uniref:Uncharacterized protein n=1 Tax=Staurois parvus TaxID=386267 RepID=A0ABN9H4W4_9NEOB|nr:unnamed protein product [Staurois parvus]
MTLVFYLSSTDASTLYPCQLQQSFILSPTPTKPNGSSSTDTNALFPLLTPMFYSSTFSDTIVLFLHFLQLIPVFYSYPNDTCALPFTL